MCVVRFYWYCFVRFRQTRGRTTTYVFLQSERPIITGSTICLHLYTTMQYKSLRCFMRRLRKYEKHNLKDCQLVIDAKSFFHHSYRNSGCSYLLGGEYDRFANYLKTILDWFIKRNVTCFVVFNGAMDADLETRKSIHQKIIDGTDSIVPGVDSGHYAEPAFVKDVVKEVLEDLGIKYYVCMYDARETILGLARFLRCHVLSDCIEYCLYNVSCISIKSLQFENNAISCHIYNSRNWNRVYHVKVDVMPIFLTLVDEDLPFFDEIPNYINSPVHNRLPLLFRWMIRNGKDRLIEFFTKKMKSEDEIKMFFLHFDKNKNLLNYHMERDALKVLFTVNRHVEVDRRYFKDSVTTGRVPVPYINLVYNNTISGSWLIVEKEKPDAVLAAIDIVIYAHGLLSEKLNSTITFIGRKYNHSATWEIEYNKQSSGIKTGCSKDLFLNFVKSTLPGLNLNLLNPLPKDCWILIITLAYFRLKLNREFTIGVYSIILSYVMLSKVSEKTGLLKRSNFIGNQQKAGKSDKNVDNVSYQDCFKAAEALIDLFYYDDKLFDRSILHQFAEFQHCLQHMNYLNRLCGERIPCTLYYKAYNGTFAYRAYILMQDGDPLSVVEKHLGSSSVFQFFKKIVNVYSDLGCK